MEKKTIYVAPDGEEFYEQVDCLRYERVLPFCKSLDPERRAEFSLLQIREPFKIVELIFDERKGPLADVICALADLIRAARAADSAESPR